jgi:hypothetical protein
MQRLTSTSTSLCDDSTDTIRTVQWQGARGSPHLPGRRENCVYWSSHEYALCRDTDWSSSHPHPPRHVIIPIPPGWCPDIGWVITRGPSSTMTKVQHSRGAVDIVSMHQDILQLQRARTPKVMCTFSCLEPNVPNNNVHCPNILISSLQLRLIAHAKFY